MTELSKYFRSREGTEGHHSGTSRHCVCPYSRRTLDKEWSLQPDYVKSFCSPGFAVVVCLSLMTGHMHY